MPSPRPPRANDGVRGRLAALPRGLALLAAAALVLALLQAALARSRQGTPAGAAAAKEESDTCATIADAVQRQPERVPAAVWASLTKDCAGAAGAGRVPLWDAWFGPLPQGTAYEAETRLGEASVSRRLTAEAVDALRALRPTSTRLFELSIERRLGRRPTPAEYLTEMGAVFAYSVPALSAWAKLERERDGHEARGEALRRLCALQADECVWYGRFLAARSRDDQARAAFERARSSARDRVMFTAYSGWLAHHYLDRGERARARALAQESAATYATGALDALGEIHERLTWKTRRGGPGRGPGLPAAASTSTSTRWCCSGSRSATASSPSTASASRTARSTTARSPSTTNEKSSWPCCATVT